MRNFFDNLPLVIWIATFFIGTILLVAFASAEVLIGFLGIMILIFFIGAIYLI